ncbi:hypothetical protein [Domibacillus epiphyticus]|uniref:Uncharacterized protein n=1 Tax=Domibacillus epiphyticus TaxID=1714355 RepID=A0A1V2AA21_9BACI|nr:hypothetical protein [Domibacillus epiphyticus]OMP67846.1 hypothetical protein BTO28_04995 [Domibacillus epiphyticus]
MMKKLASSGLALGLAFGAGSAALANGAEESQVDLSTKLNTELHDGYLSSNQELQAMAESNNWTVKDLQVWADANGLTEADLQNLAEKSGWSEEEISSLNLDVNASIGLGDLLDGSDNLLDSINHEDNNLTDNLLDEDLLGGIL